jgi:phytoene dehydrogenase-like protein
MIADARSHIIERINRVLKTNIEEHILFEHRADPRSIEANTGSFGGSLYGPSSNNRFAAFLRHPNFKRKFRNLYFTGGSVHPGGGIPLCLASARIVGNEIPAV